MTVTYISNALTKDKKSFTGTSYPLLPQFHFQTCFKVKCPSKDDNREKARVELKGSCKFEGLNQQRTSAASASLSVY